MTYSLSNFWAAEALATTRVLDSEGEKEISYTPSASFADQKQGGKLG